MYKSLVVPLGLTTLPISDRNLTSISFTLKMDTVLSLETLGYTKKAMRCHNTADHNPRFSVISVRYELVLWCGLPSYELYRYVPPLTG